MASNFNSMALEAAGVVDKFVNLAYETMDLGNGPGNGGSGESMGAGGADGKITVDLSATLGEGGKDLDLTKTQGIVGLGLHQVFTDNLNNAVGTLNKFKNESVQKATQMSKV